MGFRYEYALIGESERRRTREKVLATVKEFGDSRPSAMAKLPQVRAELEGKGVAPPQNPTVSELWDRYRSIKSERWSKVMERPLLFCLAATRVHGSGQYREGAKCSRNFRSIQTSPRTSRSCHREPKLALNCAVRAAVGLLHSSGDLTYGREPLGKFQGVKAWVGTAGITGWPQG